MVARHKSEEALIMKYLGLRINHYRNQPSGVFMHLESDSGKTVKSVPLTEDDLLDMCGDAAAYLRILRRQAAEKNK